MTTCYADASAILRFVLAQPDFLALTRLADQAISSPLAELECRRVLDRVRLSGHVQEVELARRRESLGSFLAKLRTIELDRKIMMRAAAPMHAPLGTLDAIHLVSALSWREEHPQPLIFATHDRELAQAARLYGLNVVGA